MMRAISLLALVAALSGAADINLSEGIAAFNQGRYAAARDFLRHSNSADATVYLALAQAASNDCVAALPVLTRQINGTDRGTDHDLGRLSGLAAARCSDTAKALAIAEDLKARFPDDADVLYLAAETEMKAFNDTTFAMFQRTASSYRVHELSARIFEVQNRFADAVTEYQKAIAINPAAPDLHFRLGRAMLLASHSPDALQSAADAFAAELKISPEDSACEFQLGQIAQVRGNSAQAQQHFEQALKLSPTFVTAMIALANLYAHDKQYDRAIALLTRAVDRQPANETAHYALLTAYRNSGQMDKAQSEKVILERLQKPPEGEFSDFLKKLGDRQPEQ